jgi:hypothetical protein
LFPNIGVPAAVYPVEFGTFSSSADSGCHPADFNHDFILSRQSDGEYCHSCGGQDQKLSRFPTNAQKKGKNIRIIYLMVSEKVVIPAQAGVQKLAGYRKDWIPVFSLFKRSSSLG